jgi:dTDP-4-dehydrorhamnose reductase
MSGRGEPVCLVTGAGGQLGRSLIAQAARSGRELQALDHAALDISDARAVTRALDELRPDWCINAAAYTAVDLCEQRQEEARRVNTDGPRVLAQACKGRALLVHLSTDYVFNGEAWRPIPEEAPASPRSVYGATKWAGEEAIRSVGGEHLIVRSQWLFGAGGNFVRTILALAAKGEPLRVVEDQLGRPTATDELARGLLRAAASGLRGTLHLACEGIASWCDFARAIVEQGARRGWNPRVAVEPVPSEAFPRPAQRPAYSVLALDRARAQGISLSHWQPALETYLDEEARIRG